MEKPVVWTAVSRKDFLDIVAYLNEFWPEDVLERFSSLLNLKVQLLQKQPGIGFKSSKYSRFRKTIITKHYMLIYSVTKDHIIIHRLKHTAMKKEIYLDCKICSCTKFYRTQSCCHFRFKCPAERS